MKTIVLHILILFVIISCGNPELPEASLSVEAYLYAGQPVKNIKLRLIKPIDATEAQPVNDAVVYIIWNDAYYQLNVLPDELGTYFSSNEDLRIIENETYYLYILYHDQEYVAATTVPLPPLQVQSSKDTINLALENDQINVTWQNPDSTWYLGVIAPDQAFETNLPFNNFFSLPTQASSIKITPEDVKLTGSQHFVLYGITDDYAKLYKISNSSIGATNVGNISNGFGIFSAFSSDTLTFVAKSP